MIPRFVLVAVMLFGMLAAEARAFVLLDYRTYVDILANRWFSWRNPRPPNQLYCPAGRGPPFKLTYAIDANFLANQPPDVRQGAVLAIRNALDSWSRASLRFLTFRQAEWQAVVNCDPNQQACCTANQTVCWAGGPCPRVHFDAPSCVEFLACTQGCATCWPNSPCPLGSGWGANIDFFSRPNGFTLISNGFLYQMTPSVLAFTVVHRSGSDSIYSIDIYLNDSYGWTTHPAEARTDPGFRFPICGTAAPALPPDIDAASFVLFDVETVVLHELGHALGLDHPEEACVRNAAQLDPFTYALLPCGQSNPGAVMRGSYTGVKRELTPDDVGGLSFLYRPRLWGDLQPDDAITFFDAVRAIELISGSREPTPYEVNIMDFRARNGRVDADEALQVVQWVIDPGSGTPGVVNLKTLQSVASAPTQIRVFAAASPPDAGLESTFNLTVRIDNPDRVRLIAWDMQVVYNQAVFTNPRLSTGTFLPGGAWAPIGPDDGSIRFAKFGIGSHDDAPAGTLGTITWDANLAAAAAGPPAVIFAFSGVQMVTDTPYIHNYGGSGELPETLIVQDAQVPSLHYDGTGDGMVDVRDLHFYFWSPFDVNKDGVVNDSDRRTLQAGVRRNEPADVVAGR